jgi:hypothetical protein
MNSYFSTELKNEQYRRFFYEHTEAFINRSVSCWDSSPDTNKLASIYWGELKKLSNNDLSFLTLVTGYIPEFYGADSSQETLYSKLVEVLVAETFIRIGYTQTTIQKQKASKEDVTIRLPGKTIVCDAKTFRLGRSQAAPNVKDTLKKADYEKWLSYYPESERVGGVITFPSLHRWKGNSDAYFYCTDHKSPIALTLYEHLAFMLIISLPTSAFVQHLENYKKAFPEPSRSQTDYFSAMDRQLFGDHFTEWNRFKMESVQILEERIAFSKEKINQFLEEKHKEVSNKVANMKEEIVRPKLIESLFSSECSELKRQLDNIARFRKPSIDI